MAGPRDPRQRRHEDPEGLELVEPAGALALELLHAATLVYELAGRELPEQVAGALSSLMRDAAAALDGPVADEWHGGAVPEVPKRLRRRWWGR